MPDLFPRDADLVRAHPLLRARWERLQPELARRLSCSVIAWECARSDERQGWLWGQGRSADAVLARGLPPAWARPGAIITNAWSARLSAHGFRLNRGTADTPLWVPASCGLDVVVLGADGRPWSADDPWDQFVALTQDGGALSGFGLIHFHAPGKQVWDKPHLQPPEWSDVTHTLEWKP